MTPGRENNACGRLDMLLSKRRTCDMGSIKVGDLLTILERCMLVEQEKKEGCQWYIMMANKERRRKKRKGMNARDTCPALTSSVASRSHGRVSEECQPKR